MNSEINSQERIRIVLTGGTFDKEYDEIRGRLFFRESHLPEMLRLGRCNLLIEISALMMIDSLDMTDSDRARIVEECQRVAERLIVITHGTDTMAVTAELLADAMESKRIARKTIVLTGAMIPYKFGSSDGMFNLGCALAFAQTLPEGVYVAMNGQYFPAGKVFKNREMGIFQPAVK